MKYNPEDANNLLADGDADFLITDVKECIAKSSGNEQFIVTFKAKDVRGKEGNVTEFFPAHLLWKLKKLCESTNQMDMFNTGNIEPEQLMNKRGKFTLKTESSPGYDDKNVVAKWIKFDASKAVDTEFHDDSIPF